MLHAFPGTIAAGAGVSTSMFSSTLAAQDRHPDLQGIWANATLTPLERPAALANKATLTPAEAAAFEKRAIASFDIDGRGGAEETDVARAYNNLFIDRGEKLAVVDGTIRTSPIVDPPDGKVPPLTPEARRRVAARLVRVGRFDSAADRPLGERCLMGFGSNGGPPTMPVLYNNNYQIVETPAAILIIVEMVHDLRVIHLDRNEHLPSAIRQWERFTRANANTILYRFTVDDPSAFTRPWTAEYPFLAAPGPIYEYACQEGNYALQDSLAGARAKEKEAEAAKK